MFFSRSTIFLLGLFAALSLASYAALASGAGFKLQDLQEGVIHYKGTMLDEPRVACLLEALMGKKAYRESRELLLNPELKGGALHISGFERGLATCDSVSLSFYSDGRLIMRRITDCKHPQIYTNGERKFAANDPATKEWLGDLSEESGSDISWVVKSPQDSVLRACDQDRLKDKYSALENALKFQSCDSRKAFLSEMVVRSGTERAYFYRAKESCASPSDINCYDKEKSYLVSGDFVRVAVSDDRKSDFVCSEYRSKLSGKVVYGFLKRGQIFDFGSAESELGIPNSEAELQRVIRVRSAISANAIVGSFSGTALDGVEGRKAGSLVLKSQRNGRVSVHCDYYDGSHTGEVSEIMRSTDATLVSKFNMDETECRAILYRFNNAVYVRSSIGCGGIGANPVGVYWRK